MCVCAKKDCVQGWATSASRSRRGVTREESRISNTTSGPGFLFPISSEHRAQGINQILPVRCTNLSSWCPKKLIDGACAHFSWLAHTWTISGGYGDRGSVLGEAGLLQPRGTSYRPPQCRIRMLPGKGRVLESVSKCGGPTQSMQ